MALVEAIGFDVVIVKTAGLGQSEVTVAEWSTASSCCWRAAATRKAPSAGVFEMADMVAITKADGNNADRALRAAAIYRGTLAILTPGPPNWTTPVLAISAAEDHGFSGESAARRGARSLAAMRDRIQGRLSALQADAAQRMRGIEDEVRAGVRTPALAVELVEMTRLARPSVGGSV